MALGCGLALAWTVVFPKPLASATASLSGQQGLAVTPAGEQRQVARAHRHLRVLLVRHAEKAGDDPLDPSLSEAGAARAKALARLLSKAPVTELVCSEYRRTRQTLEPLAELLGLSIQSFPAREPGALADWLRQRPDGSLVVVAGHSNTLPALAATLGFSLPELSATPRGPMLGEDQYDRLFLLSLELDQPDSEGELIELRYGAPSGD